VTRAAPGHPRDRVRRATERWGETEVVRLCSELLRGGSGDVQDRPLDLAMVLGGLSDRDWLAGGKPPGHGYWARVWAARALLYVWDDSASSSITAALEDEHWRVREMVAKVVALRELGLAAEAGRGWATTRHLGCGRRPPARWPPSARRSTPKFSATSPTTPNRWSPAPPVPPCALCPAASTVRYR